MKLFKNFQREAQSRRLGAFAGLKDQVKAFTSQVLGSKEALAIRG
jgi:hypothetical protein